MSRDPLDLIWRCADNPDPVLTAEETEAVPPHDLSRLARLGVLRQTATATHVTCDACAEQHVSEVTRIEYPDGAIRFFIACPENGRVEVPRERLLQWSVDYLPLLKVLASALSTSAEPEKTIPGRAWNLGRAALAGKSKPIWVARGLAWPDAARVADVLPRGRSPVLFLLGQPPDDGVLRLPRESAIELRTVMRLEDDGDLAVDRNAIESQLTTEAAESHEKKSKKRASRTAAIDLMEKALTEHIIAARDHACAAIERGDSPELLPRPEQKLLAAQLGLTEASVSRALNDERAHKLKLLWEMANDLEQVLKYGRRR